MRPIINEKKLQNKNSKKGAKWRTPIFLKAGGVRVVKTDCYEQSFQTYNIETNMFHLELSILAQGEENYKMWKNSTNS